MPPAEGGAQEPANDGDEQSADEEIRRQHECYAGIADAAQIQNGDDNKNPDADSHGMGLK